MKYYCLQCGTSLSTGSKFCTKCGNEVVTRNNVSKNTSPNHKNTMLLWVSLGIAVFILLIIASLLIYYFAYYQPKISIAKQQAEKELQIKLNRQMNEVFTLDDGNKVSITRALLKDRERKDLHIELNYSQPSTDKLRVSLYNNDILVSESHSSGAGVVSFDNIPSSDQRAYRLIFWDKNTVLLSNMEVELPYAGPNLFEEPKSTTQAVPTAQSQQTPQYVAPAPSSVHCTSYSSSISNWGTVNCYQY